MDHDLPDPEAADNIVYNPSFDEMREYSSHLEQTTEYGSPAYVTDIRSRSAEKTKNAVDHDITEADRDHIRRAQQRMRETEMVCVDRRMGRHPDHSYICRYYVPVGQARIALSWHQLLDPVSGEEPDFHTVQFPDWEGTRIRVFPDEGATYVLGSDYTGEAKMSFLRLFLYHAKQRGGLGLHAGSKRITIHRDDDLVDVGQLFLGLSATGKTTLTSHGLWLDDGQERAAMLQDDICALTPDGAAAGSEGGGLYIKTYGLTAEEQPELHHAATRPHTVLENVAVADDGTVDFFDDTLTRNGRAVIRRADLDGAADTIDLDTVDQIFFITRNPIMPPIAKLTHDQAAAAFMLGESVQTSAGDPERAGEAIRVVGTNPFIIGSKGAEGNRFHDLVQDNDMDCFLMNTGRLGPDTPITVKHSVTLLKAVARDTIAWTHDDLLGLHIPETVPGMNIDRFYPPDHIPDFEQQLAATREDRRAHLARFDMLRDEIHDAVY